MPQAERQGTSNRKRDAANKLADHRLSVLALAREFRTLTEVCRRRGLDRTSFYERRRRFQTYGVGGNGKFPICGNFTNCQPSWPDLHARGHAEIR